ncbi:MAG: DUF3298 and DUF4163 domain-containing protein [Thermodesulfobacteriota bacterium]
MNIFRVILLGFILVFSASFVSADEKEIAKYYFVGGIGGELAIQMELQLQGSQVRGTYYYEKTAVPLRLLGQVDFKENTITLTESDDKKNKTGQFEGKFTPIPDGIGTTIQGTWFSPDKNTRLPFGLTKVSNYEFLSIKQGNFSEAKWSYPKLISENEVIQQITPKLSDSMKPQIDEYQKDAKEGFMEDLITSTWLFNYDYSIEYYSEDLLSFIGVVYSYTGGAHGNTYFVSSNYLIGDDDSKLLKLEDLFKTDSDYVKVLSSLIIKDLKKQKADWVLSGSVTSLKEDEIGPFAVNPAGIRFAFAPYAMGPYSQGAFFVTVNYEDLGDLIDPQGPIAKFIKPAEKQNTPQQ